MVKHYKDFSPDSTAWDDCLNITSDSEDAHQILDQQIWSIWPVDVCGEFQVETVVQISEQFRDTVVNSLENNQVHLFAELQKTTCRKRAVCICETLVELTWYFTAANPKNKNLYSELSWKLFKFTNAKDPCAFQINIWWVESYCCVNPAATMEEFRELWDFIISPISHSGMKLVA